MAVFLIVAVLTWVARGGFDHARADYRRSREAEVKKAAKGQPGGKLPAPREAAVRRRHGIGYWTREVTHGLPVVRTGLHTGWVAHKTARRRAEEANSEARAAHAETETSVLKRIIEHHDRQMQAYEELEKIWGEQPPVSGKPREQAAEVADLADKRRQKAEAEGEKAVPPLPSETVGAKRPAQICRVCTQPGTADDPLVPNALGLVHRSHNERGDAVLEAWRNAEPGPYAPPPTRRIDGKPETEADRKFLALRESGYEGPPGQDGNAVPDEMADAARNPEPIPPSGRRMAQGEPDDYKYVPCPDCGAAIGVQCRPDCHYDPADPRPIPPSPPTGGDTVTATDTTFTSVINAAKAAIGQNDQDAAQIRASKESAYRVADDMAAAGCDPAAIDAQMNYADSLAKAEQALAEAGEHAQNTAATVERMHGGMQAAHDDAPGKVASREFHGGN